MYKFGRVKAAITNAINNLDRVMSSIKPDDLAPFHSDATLDIQLLELARRSEALRSAKLNIHFALDRLQERYDSAYDSIQNEEEEEQLA